MTVRELEFEGSAVILEIPDRPNGEWIWKTEFFHAFDRAERELLAQGYTRVYLSVSDRYGSYRAVRKMHRFYRWIVKELGLREQCHLFGFSRGGLYAMNFALAYPEYVASVYLDAPVLDMRSWPPADSRQMGELLREYSLTPDTLAVFPDHPLENAEEFFALGLPLLIVAGGADEVVPLEENAGALLRYAESHGHAVESVVKPLCAHHPHSLEDDPSPILSFVKRHSL